MQDRYEVPACAIGWLRSMGYEPYTAMDGDVQRWLGWYTGKGKFYERAQVDWSSGEPRRVTRTAYSLRPARRVCREWASLLFDEGTRFAADEPRANEWLQGWCDRVGVLSEGQSCVERAFALGTGALALSFDLPADAARAATMRLRRYDARMVLPLSWDGATVTECAFATDAFVRGRRVSQVTAHVVGEAGTYEIRSAWFDAEGERVHPDGLLDALDTGQALPTFAVVRPAVDNLVADLAPMGQSVFEDAIDAIRGVDEAWDALVRELAVCKPRVFLDDQLLRVTDRGGHEVMVPLAPEESVVRAVRGSGSGGDLIRTFQPTIRTAQMREALDTALAELGDLTGFGQQYFTLSKSGGLKTATEVSADSSALMRNLRKHEMAVGASLSSMLTAAVSCAGAVLGEDVPAPSGRVRVSWDDSIIEDTPAEKAQALSEVAGGLLAPWEYRARFLGEDEETARAMADEAARGGVGGVGALV